MLTKSFHKESIKLLADLCKNKCTPIIAYIPSSDYWKIYNKSTINFNLDTYKIDLKNTSEKLGVKFVDGAKVINKNNLSDYSPKGYHLSINGYKKISDEIVKSINKN